MLASESQTWKKSTQNGWNRDKPADCEEAGWFLGTPGTHMPLGVLSPCGAAGAPRQHGHPGSVDSSHDGQSLPWRMFQCTEWKLWLIPEPRPSPLSETVHQFQGQGTYTPGSSEGSERGESEMAHVVTVIFGKNNLRHQLWPTENLKNSRTLEMRISKGDSWGSLHVLDFDFFFKFNLENKMHWSGEHQLYSREEFSALTLSLATFYSTALFLFLVPR